MSEDRDQRIERKAREIYEAEKNPRWPKQWGWAEMPEARRAPYRRKADEALFQEARTAK